MRAPTFTVGLVQMACSSDQADNLDRATALTRKGVKEGAEIICLQELFNLQCWALTCESFFDEDEWVWLYGHFGYTGDYEFIYFE